MVKKTFKGSNPALQFISAAAVAAESPSVDAAKHVRPQQTTNLGEPASGEEKKSRRLNLLLQPSVMDDIGKIARMSQTSVNDLINKALREYGEARQDVIAKYNEVFGNGN